MRFGRSNRLLKTGVFTFGACVFILILWSINNNKFSKELLAKFEAKNKTPKMIIRQNGEYWILQNYITATKQFGYLDSVTYTTHGEFTFLDNVEELVKRWQGPISLAVFAPRSDFFETLRSIDYLRRCSNERHLIKELVSFHIYFPSDHMPDFIPKLGKEFKRFSVNCDESPPFLVEANVSYRHTKSLPYPINLSRNIARQSVTTHFIFPSDIEMYPNMNFVEEFLDLVHRKPDFLLAKRRVYPLAVFEIDKTEDVPNTKADLREMLYTKKAVPFHQSFCMQCHAIPYLDKWIGEKESAQLDIFAIVKHHSDWEPFYVTTNDEPFFDERYTWEGRYDKQIQGDLLGLLNYDFYILNNAFLVHRPGIKQYSVSNYSAIENVNMRTKNEVIPQLRTLYG